MRTRLLTERDTQRAGFTLIEVTVTVLIMSLILTSVTRILSAVRISRDTIHNIQETQLAGPAILDIIERDLRGLVATNFARESLFKLENKVVYGREADRMDFVTTTDSLLFAYEDERAMRSDVTEVGFCLRPSPTTDDFLELYRREGFGVDDLPFEGGNYIFLHDRVKSFDVFVYDEDGIDAEPIEEWNTDNSPDTQGLPVRIEIALTLELAPRLMREQLAIAPIDRRTLTYRRIMRLPEILRVEEANIPRPGVPVAPGTEPPAAAPGGDGRDQDDEGGGDDIPLGGGGGGNSGGGGGDDRPASKE